MEHHTYCRNFLSHKKFSFTTRHEPSSSSSSPPEFHVNFELICKPREVYWGFAEHSGHPLFLGTIRLPMTTKLIRLNLDQFVDQENACQIIAEEINSWPLDDSDHRYLINFTLEKAHAVMKSMPASHNAVYLSVSAVPSVSHVLSETELAHWLAQGSTEEAGNCMVPAANSVIESLESMKILLLTNDGFDNCSVCLEEFSRGCEAVCLPCSHVFHEDCIKDWLRTSHYCPLCRFEMPTT